MVVAGWGLSLYNRWFIVLYLLNHHRVDSVLSELFKVSKNLMLSNPCSKTNFNPRSNAHCAIRCARDTNCASYYFSCETVCECWVCPYYILTSAVTETNVFYGYKKANNHNYSLYVDLSVSESCDSQTLNVGIPDLYDVRCAHSLCSIDTSHSATAIDVIMLSHGTANSSYVVKSDCPSDHMIRGEPTCNDINGVWSTDPWMCLPTQCYIRRDSDGVIFYAGTLNTTATGRTCQFWNSQSPHSHDYTSNDLYNFEFNDINRAMNYCRDLGWGHGAWCYTTDPAFRWDNCSVPVCI